MKFMVLTSEEGKEKRKIKKLGIKRSGSKEKICTFEERIIEGESWYRPLGGDLKDFEIIEERETKLTAEIILQAYDKIKQRINNEKGQHRKWIQKWIDTYLYFVKESNGSMICYDVENERWAPEFRGDITHEYGIRIIEPHWGKDQLYNIDTGESFSKGDYDGVTITQITGKPTVTYFVHAGNEVIYIDAKTKKVYDSNGKELPSITTVK